MDFRHATRTGVTHCINAVAMMTPEPKNLQKSKTSGWARTDLERLRRMGANVPMIEVTYECENGGGEGGMSVHVPQCDRRWSQENACSLAYPLGSRFCTAGHVPERGTHEDDEDGCDTETVPRVVERGGTGVLYDLGSVFGGGVHIV